MKKLKKLLALVLTLAICATFALPALAEGDDQTPDGGDTLSVTGYNLTMNNPQPDHDYVIYQLLKGTVLPGSDNIPTGTLGDVKWGESITVPENGVVTLNGKEYKSAQDYADYLKNLSASELDAEINAIKGSLNGSYSVTSVTNEAGSLVWNVPGGYYAVIDETEGDLDDSNPRSNVMAQVVGDTTITPKPESLIPDKGVKEAEEAQAEYEKIINSEVGKVLDYEVAATVSVGTMNLNEEYWVALVDTMTKGHTYLNDTAKIEILGPDGKSLVADTAEGYPEIKSSNNQDGTITLTVDKFNLKSLIGTAMPTTGNVTVKLTYQAVVNADAIEAKKVENEVIWSTGVDHNGETMEDGTPIKTITYVYELKGEKIDGENKAPLAGAEFKLTREDGSEVTIYKISDGEYFAWNGGDDGKPTGEPVTDNVIVANGGKDNNTFVVKGLAEGTYTLTETKTPDGYNTMAALTIKIVPVLDDNGDPTGGCVYHYEKSVDDEGNVIKDDEGNDTYKDSSSVLVINNKGSQLPSTGGIGTTIFYIVGAVLVVGAGVLLFTKRRARG